jgi:hypothetical protein
MFAGRRLKDKEEKVKKQDPRSEEDKGKQR